MRRRAVGDVRPSQIITTFGPGAIVDLQTTSVVVGGIDHWMTDEDLEIREPRLSRSLGIRSFFAAKPAAGSFSRRVGTVPTYLFPRYQVCPVCRTLSQLGDGLARYEAMRQEVVCLAPRCKGRGKYRATTLPAPFVVACPSGHIDDFPWREYVHTGHSSCNLPLRLRSTAKTGSVADLRVSCECKASRSASAAFGEDRKRAIGPCTRHQPWLGIGHRDNYRCQHTNEVRTLQRGATNAWFPVVRTALSVGEVTTPIGMALRQCRAEQLDRVDSIDTLKTLLSLGMFPSLESLPRDDIWASIQKQRGELQIEEVDLRWPEWCAFLDAPSHANDTREFFLEVAAVPPAHSALIASVVLARKLLEVRALVGFTRIDPLDNESAAQTRAGVATLARQKQDWLPAIQTRGEGIFISLREDAVAAWENKTAVNHRFQTMLAKYREWANSRRRPASGSFDARYLLLHSLSHALIRQLSLACGYPSSSVRERIYSSRHPGKSMAGILLYTASADSEGSLGGLVDLGTQRRFPDLLRRALRDSMRCSSDPLCADHRPDAHASINAAACHACLLVSETSCEAFNRFLDRNSLVATMATDSLAFFPS